MLRIFGPVSDVFELTGRGCIVLVADGGISLDVRLHVGDEVAIVSGKNEPIRTKVVGIELGNRSNVGFVGVLLGPEIKKIDVMPNSSLMKEDR